MFYNALLAVAWAARPREAMSRARPPVPPEGREAYRPELTPGCRNPRRDHLAGKAEDRMSQPQDGRNPLLSAALQYANLGWRVFALAPRSKIPRRGSHGFLDATRETEVLERWWKEEPQANVAIATGPHTGLMVLDIDLRHGGDASLYELERHWGELPDTLTVNTSGGWHLYFGYASPPAPLLK
ncbi:MAG: bifunctional DNA primase/polymerase, partial [Armatimonadetes bacterium]|nr:bifunctional DNA primase/polymerase [Armatimonadota bacterium]